MKKTFSLIAIAFISLFLFSACGVQGAGQVTGIEFVQDVFYVDYNVETKLEYRLFPSTATNVTVYQDYGSDVEEEKYYNLEKFKIVVFDERFESATVYARVNNYESSCEVRLKEYPTSVSFDNATEVINSGSLYRLNLKALFEDSADQVTLEDSQFNYKITSSDPSVVEVVNESNLLLRSTGRRGSSRIEVQLCNSLGSAKRGLKASVQIDVIESVESVFASLGNKTTLSDKMELVFNDDQVSDLTVSLDEEMGINFFQFDEDGFLISNAGYDIFLSNDSVMEKIETADGVKLKVKGNGETVVTIQSKLLNKLGNPLKIRVKIKVQNL